MINLRQIDIKQMTSSQFFKFCILRSSESQQISKLAIWCSSVNIARELHVERFTDRKSRDTRADESNWQPLHFSKEMKFSSKCSKNKRHAYWAVASIPRQQCHTWVPHLGIGAIPPWVDKHIWHSQSLHMYAACHCPPAWEMRPKAPQSGSYSCLQIAVTPALQSKPVHKYAIKMMQ